MEPGIYIESKEAPGYGIHGKRHLYLVYRDEDGNEEVIRGGPDSLMLGNIGTQTGISLKESKDKYELRKYRVTETPESRGARKIDLKGRDPKIVWKQMTAGARQIDGAEARYTITPDKATGDLQNSNSAIRHAFEAAGLDPAETFPDDYSADMHPGLPMPLAPSRSRRKMALPSRMPRWRSVARAARSCM